MAPCAGNPCYRAAMTRDLHPAGRQWRAMSVADLPAVNTLAARIHPAFPEDDAVFAERLRLYPGGCRVFERDRGIEAYVVSHPWRRLEPPVLNSRLVRMPSVPSTFYIHDLALAPTVRGTGAATLAVAQLVACAKAERLSNLSLIAVNGSAGFWQRQGFAAVHEPALTEKLRSYGNDAHFMVRDLG